MQALGQDLLEATTHARTMTPEEIEEMIDYLLDEVTPSTVVITGFLLTFWIKHSMEKILLAFAYI